MRITVKDSQNIQDIAMQYTGSIDNVVKIAMANNISPTEIIVKGMELEIPSTIIITKQQQALIDLYKVEQRIPSSGGYEDSDDFDGDFDNTDFDNTDFLT